ncbi:MAG: dienelactone hydrolase family protein [Pseudomonadota bacterium]
MCYRTLWVLLLAGFMNPLWAAVVGDEVSYRVGNTVMKGYLAYDDAIKVERPGILVVHEWWGHNEYARSRARQLAGLGYTALAVDMYGEGKQAAHPEDAAKFSGALMQNMPLAEERFRAALHLIREQPTVDAERIGAIGYCFGGGIVLEMARRSFDLDAVASFHGSLTTTSPPEKGAVRAKILVANGAADPFVKPEHIKIFKAQMDAAGADYRLENYPSVKHSFTNPDADKYGEKFALPLAYDAGADKASWAAMRQLFDEAFAR